jgi:FkbM family methyltransferase
MTFPEERAAITNLLKTFPDPVCIVELGAHEGEDSEWMLEVVKSTQQRTCAPYAVMVEADHANFMKLVSRGLPGWYAYLHAAIADHDGVTDFWECRESGGGFGSLYRPLSPGLSVDSSAFTLTHSVPCFTFDTLFRNERLNHIDLLWVDIHGAERAMIEHGREALKRTRYLFIEAFDQPVYEGMATRSELLAMLPGWTLVQTFPWNLLLRNEHYDSAAVH